MTEPNLSDLIAQRAEINRQIAAAELGPAQEALGELTKTATRTMLTKLTTIVETLPDSNMRDQIQNVVTVLNNVPTFVERCVAELDAIVNPPSPEDEPTSEDPAAEG